MSNIRGPLAREVHSPEALQVVREVSALERAFHRGEVVAVLVGIGAGVALIGGIYAALMVLL
jgi:hypothetical protein